MQIEAALKFAKIPVALQEVSLDMAVQLRRMKDAISDYRAEGATAQPSTKIRRSPKGKIREEEAADVLTFIKDRGLEVKSW